MNEQQRAEALVRSIDWLIRGAQEEQARQQDEELRSLVDVAAARRQVATDAGKRSVDHESDAWRRLSDKLDSRGNDDDGHQDKDQDSDMRDIIAARRRVSEDVLELAERHREEVWRRVQEKVANHRPKKKGIFSFLESIFRDPALERALNAEDSRNAKRVRLSSGSLNRLRVRLRLDPGNHTTTAH
jgi:hypothetical protein